MVPREGKRQFSSDRGGGERARSCRGALLPPVPSPPYNVTMQATGFELSKIRPGIRVNPGYLAVSGGGEGDALSACGQRNAHTLGLCAGRAGWSVFDE